VAARPRYPGLEQGGDLRKGFDMELKVGDIIRYIYRGSFEFARWHGNNTIELLPSKDTPRDALYFIAGVWKKEVFFPRKKILIK
jgi:hypothetical protein